MELLGFTSVNAGENPQSVVVPPVEGVGGGGTAYGWTDGSLECSYSFKGVADPAKVPSAELLYVWCMPSTATIGQQEMPRPLESVSSPKSNVVPLIFKNIVHLRVPSMRE